MKRARTSNNAAPLKAKRTHRTPPRSHARELSILDAIAEALNSATDVQKALERTLGLVAGLLGLRTGWIWLLDPETGFFYNAAAQNLPPYLQEPVRMTGKSCWCIEGFKAGVLDAKNVDVMECSRLRAAVQGASAELTHGLRYHASIPLSFQNKPLGILNVTTPSWRKLSHEELRLLSTIASQVGIALERARLADEGSRLARVEERARIAREIHDTLAQGLTAIGLQIESALHQFDRDPKLARQRMQRALAVTRDNLEDARRSVNNLRAAELDGKPLAGALGALARAFTSETGVRVHLDVQTARPVPQALEGELFRIAQEALTNVRRHAAAHEARLQLAVTARTVRLTVEDDGRGFAPRTVAKGRHGLVGMRERAGLLGGRVAVHSRAGQGTRITVAVPIPSVPPERARATT